MKGKLLTQYSSHANTIADTVRAAFGRTKVGMYSVEMTAPEGSTKGGLLALQHLTLKPETGAVLVAGTVNAGEKRAELRSYAQLAKLNEERFKRPLDFDEESYKAFLEKAESVLGAFGIETTVTAPLREDVDPSLAEAPEPDASTRSSNTLVWVVLALCLAVAGGGAWYALHR